MTLSQWYELRVAGSPGTTTGAAGIKEGIAIGDNGRLCSIASGHAMKFESEQQALDYLGRTTIPGNYRFEAVPCGPAAASHRNAASLNGGSPAWPPR
jgi:hypothetical protein